MAVLISDERINQHIDKWAKANPQARTCADVATPKQLVCIRAIANSQGRIAEDECKEFFQQQVRPEELSRRAASAFIDHLKRTDNRLPLAG